MKTKLILLSLVSFISTLSQAATLSCTLREPKFNFEIEKEIDSGAVDVSFYETIKVSVEVQNSHAQLRLEAPRSNTVALINVNGKKLNYEISSQSLDSKISGTVSQSLSKVIQANYSNFHIDASDVFTNEITLNCQIK